MFRRMTPPRPGPKVEERTYSGTSVGSDYSESGPELETAIMNKNWSVVRKCVAQGMGMARKHLLHKAVRSGAPVEIIQMMVEKGCHVDELQEGNWTTLHFAAKYDASLDVVNYLVKAGANVDHLTSTGESPLFFAAERDAEAMVDALIKAGADFNRARSSDGITPLMIVVHNHSSANEAAPWILQLLIDAGADVNAGTNDGTTALHIATQKGCSKEMLICLLKGGADANRAKKNGDTALITLIQNHPSSATLIELLLQAGADVNLANSVGETPISVAAQKNISPSIMEMLIRAGGDVNKPTISGLTPVFAAVLEGASKDLVSLMLKYGADIVSHKFQRKSALEVAQDRGFLHLKEVLDPANQVVTAEFLKVDFTFLFCAMCRKSEKSLTPCRTCNLVAYCSEECKARHWKVGGHKNVCTAVLSHMGEDDEEE